MKKEEAKELGYCEFCAAVTNGKQLCGVLKRGPDKDFCQLDIETQERWRKEHGLPKRGEK